MASAPHLPQAPRLSSACTGAVAPDVVLQIESSALFKGQRLLEINHAGQRYQLRLTRENKLILTK